VCSLCFTIHALGKPSLCPFGTDDAPHEEKHGGFLDRPAVSLEYFLDLREKIRADRDGHGFCSLFNGLPYVLMNGFTGFPVFLCEQERRIHGFQASFNFRRDHAVSPPLLVDGAFFAPPAISRQPLRLRASSFHNHRSGTRASRWT